MTTYDDRSALALIDRILVSIPSKQAVVVCRANKVLAWCLGNWLGALRPPAQNHVVFASTMTVTWPAQQQHDARSNAFSAYI